LDWGLTVLSIGGIALFFFDQFSFSANLGNIYALLSGVCFAAMAMLLRRQKDASPMESVLLGNLLTVVVGLPFALTDPPAPGSWTGVVLMGVVQLGIPYVMYATAIRHVRALEACLIGTIEPVLNPIWVALFLGEKPTRWALVGGAIVLGAATVRGLSTALGPSAPKAKV
jgi:drug/metabolite transporter (DMT)-like permease